MNIYAECMSNIFEKSVALCVTILCSTCTLKEYIQYIHSLVDPRGAAGISPPLCSQG